MMNQEQRALKREKLNQETARIPWTELQRYFAAGRVIHVADDVDLIDCALECMQDNAPQFRQWIEQGRVQAVSDTQARGWLESGAALWAVVVKPWVLVQERA